MSPSGDITYQDTYDQIPEAYRERFCPPGPDISTEEELVEEKKLSKGLLPFKSTTDDLTRRTGDWAVYKYYFSSVGLIKMLMFVSFVSINIFCCSFSQIWLQWWTNVGGGQLPLYVTIYFLLAVLNSVSNGGYVWSIFVHIAPSTGWKFHHRLLNAVMRAPQSFFTKTDIGTILNRFSQDMTLIEGSLATTVLLTISNLFSSLAQATLISTGSAYMAVTIPFLMIGIFVLQKIYLRTSRQLRFLDLESRSPIYAHFLESLKVLDLIVAALAVIVVGLAVGLRNSTNPGALGVTLNNVLGELTADSKTSRVGTISLAGAIWAVFNVRISSLVTGWTMLETSLGAIARLKSLEAGTLKEARRARILYHWKTGLRPVSSNSRMSQLLTTTLIQLPCDQAADTPDISAKSSLLGILLRILEIDSGSIKIDGIDLASLSRETIRERLITIPQDCFMLRGCLRLNADPNGTASDSNIIAALTRVHLWDMLKERGGLSNKLDGHSLSKGQQQLLALARAIWGRARGREAAF
ncbi:MAG: hypothetical protein MMC33_010250 [Icmadophila ericetorum]|nr:hypothetical protein [Icmadophila ericetorum]